MLLYDFKDYRGVALVLSNDSLQETIVGNTMNRYMTRDRRKAVMILDRR